MTITSPTSLIEAKQDGAVLQITINNPPANTWTLESLNGLKSVVEAASSANSVVAIVIHGQGEKFFSAGADLKQFASGDKTASKEVAEAFGEAFEALANFEGVTVAAINGYAMGGGLECALACDIRIAEEQAQLALPEAKVGLLPCAGGTQRLSWLVGEAWASRIILLGERIKADTAERIGLTQETAAAGQSLSRALEVAQQVAQQSPDAVRACKRLIKAPRERAIAQGLEDERTEFIDLIGETNQLEGTNAFLEKRSPSWS
jgi:enoyl-CoA hydratase/carnithine racemase